ncbi:MAG: efflux RND transporter periplasmic adaptor subunit [Flavobacteriales bacterium]|nr:efflux RND transporter periplasmic adaptor subunit [Flavobacteriales bacterium]
MKYLAYISLFVLALSSCHSNEPEGQDHPETTPTPEVEKKVTVPVSANIECFGTVDVPPFAIYEEYAKTTGYVVGLSILEGQHVKQGEVIAEIESPEFARLQKELQTAKANYDWQKQRYERNQPLYQNKAISDKDFQLIEKDYQVAKSAYFGLKEEVNAIGFSSERFIDAQQLKLQIRSKTHGTVVQINIKNGSKVSPDTHLFTILDQSHLHVEMYVSGNDIGRVKQEQAFYLTHQDDTIRGTVHLINDRIEDDNTVKVHGHLNNKADEEKLIVGQKVFVNILP